MKGVHSRQIIPAKVQLYGENTQRINYPCHEAYRMAAIAGTTG